MTLLKSKARKINVTKVNTIERIKNLKPHAKFDLEINPVKRSSVIVSKFNQRNAGAA